MSNHKLLLITIVTLLIAAPCTAQYSFTNYDYTHGLPLDEINVIKEDSSGYLWLGGPMGLARFDGQKFKSFDQGDLPGDIVSDIDITPSGRVVASFVDQGIAIYDPKTETIVSRIYREEDGLNFPKYHIYSTYIQNDTTAILCGTEEDIYQLNLISLESKLLIESNRPREIIEDPIIDDCYLFTANGLHRYCSDDETPTKLSKNGFYGLKVIGDELWFNNYFGKVIRYNLVTGASRSYTTIDNGVIRGWTIVGENVWIGMHYGVVVIDLSSGDIQTVLNSKSASKPLSGDFVYDVYKDSRGYVWVSTNGGLSMYNPNESNFEDVDFLQGRYTHLSRVGDDQLVAIDFYDDEITYITANNTKHSIQPPTGMDSPVEVIREGSDIYIVFFNGIGKLDLDTKVISPFDCPFTTSTQRGLIQVKIFGDRWLGLYAYKNTLIDWSSSTDRCDTIQLTGEPKGIVKIDDQKVCVFGKTLCTYDMSNRSVVHQDMQYGNVQILGKDIVNIDKGKSDYWVSSRRAGLWKATFLNDTLLLKQKYDKDDGLPNNNVIETITDHDGTPYTYNRVGVFRHDEENDIFTQVGKKRSINVTSTHGLTYDKHKLYVVGEYSQSIDLDYENTYSETPQVFLNNIYINGDQKVNYNEDYLSLPYNDNTIKIDYDVVFFEDPTLLNVRYRLDTISDWVLPTSSVDPLFFSSLSPGDYQLQISSRGKSPTWTKPYNFHFKIKPPFWRSWWFILLSICTAAIVIYAIDKRRIRQLDRLNTMNLKIAELEGESLRAQMNPHFVFNALNSIKSFIIKNNKEEAADYLTAFSELMRAVLNNSKQKEISIKNELEALSLYLKIERQRLNNKFEYNINISDNLDINQIAIPPLIIQPFVENSIWHGLLHKEEQGSLDININRENNIIIIEVIDDGIGRTASKKIESTRTRKRSYGIAITKTRLDNVADPANISIEDMYDNGKSIGTKVVIRIPYKSLANKKMS